MKPLYTPEEFALATTSQSLNLRCIHCDNVFSRKKSDISHALKRGYEVNYCSAPCKTAHISIKCKCDECGKELIQLPSVHKLYTHHFCSRRCNGLYRFKHGAFTNSLGENRIGKCRSKLEKWIELQIGLIYPDLEVHYNRNDAINSELDIFIPSLRLAIELNGAYHYEPIYGPDKLSKVQNNDARKMQACLERNIEFCSIDASELGSFDYFKEKRGQKYLDIIKHVINQKICEQNNNYLAENI